jgi:superfamily II DNA or RNA helicase
MIKITITNITSIDLYPHNQETYQRICEMWKTTSRVAAIQATGTGKTYLILRCTYDFYNDNKVILAPSNYILDQISRKLEGKVPNVKFLTYIRLSQMSIEEIRNLDPSLIILDEFHRCGAEKWEQGVVALLEIFPNAKVLGTSATPIRYLDNERDMTDELFDGNIAVNLSLTDAIIKGILPMPKYISALYTFDDEIEKMKERISKSHNDEKSKKELLKEMDSLKNKLNKSKGVPEILNKHITDKGGKYIVFCKDKNHLNEMEQIVVSWFKRAKIGNKVEKYRVISSESENEKEMKAFRENKREKNVRLLFSIEMLNEGIHIDDVTGVILLRPTISPIIYYQQIGRAIQVGNSKIPTIFDFVNNFNNIRTLTFIKDLQKSISFEISRRKKNGEIDFDIPEFTIIDEMKDVTEMFSLLEIEIQSYWDAMYQKFINNNCNYEGNDKLFQWVSSQRYLHRKNLLDRDKIEKLNEINFIWNPLDEKWDEMYEMMRTYKEEFGHCDLTQSDVNSDLYAWAVFQRTCYKKGIFAKNERQKERLKKLDDLGFIWDSRTRRFDEMYNRLISYTDENGIFSWGDLDNKMQKWVHNLRTSYKNGELSPEKTKKLKEIGFNFSPRGTNDVNESQQ